MKHTKPAKAGQNIARIQLLAELLKLAAIIITLIK